MAGDRIHLKLDSTAAASVNQYLKYRRIVGDDDGGKLFTPEEYEEYKKNVLPQRMKNRLYVSWTAPSGMDCKMVGPETMCFCNHRINVGNPTWVANQNTGFASSYPWALYKQHKTDHETLPQTRPIPVPCRVSGCRCKSYHYVPKNGTQPIRCRCKHFADDHSEVAPYKCSKGCACKKFTSSYTCSCGEPTYAHKTIIETKEERISRGHPIGYDVPYAAMGGITGFSSLIDGYMRLDDSGIGPPPLHMLEQPVGPDDHPFLRAQAGLAGLSLEDGMGAGVGQVVCRTTEEEDMAYFEKRYQARLKAEKKQKSPQSKRSTGPHIAQQSMGSVSRRTGPSQGKLATKPATTSQSPGPRAERQSNRR